MKPISPVIPGLERQELVFAENQPQYRPLPALPVEDGIVTRWRFSWRERFRILWYGDLYLWVKTFGEPLHPVLLQVHRPAITSTTEPYPEE